MPRKSKLVDFISEQDDHRCAFLAALGYSTYFIMQETGLSECQVTYRIKKAGLTKANGRSRMDFRNGTSPYAKIMLRSTATSIVDKELVEYLKKNL